MPQSHSSDEARTILANKVDELRRHEIQFWQFLFGQVPNCRDITPTATSWCGGVTAGIDSIRRTIWLVIALGLMNAGFAHASQIMDVIKLITK